MDKTEGTNALRAHLLFVIAIGLTVGAGCGRPSPGVAIDLARFPIDGLDDLMASADVTFDPEISHDGNGALRVDATRPRVVPLYEIADPDVEDTRLVYEAFLRTEDLEGRAYLEMWCVFDEQGEYFSRGLTDPLSGSVEWTHRQIPFFLKAGENPDRLKLNLVVEGSGTVWIDDVVVSTKP